MPLNSCKVCDQELDNRNVFRVKEMMFGFNDEFNYWECPKCGCLQISEIPNDLSKYYPSKYYSFSKQPNTLMRKIINKRNNYLLFKKGRIGEFINKRYPNDGITALSRVKLNKETKILDIGCGSGCLLYGLKETGFKNLLGIDKFISKDIIYKNGLNIHKKELTQITEQYDILMFHQSFEHIPNQLETLILASKLLTNNGVCIISTPTTSSYAWKHYRENWVQLDAPRHLCIHSIKSLEILAKKANLKLNLVFYNSNSFQFIGSEQYKLDIPLCSSHKLFSRREKKYFETKAKELDRMNQGDVAIFYLTQ